ncbi:MAG: dihydrofolate reductase, partial [Aestuariivirgaceae bacterium]
MARQKRVTMPSISFIVARSYPGNVIGCENELPWSLKTDLKNFRTITTGHVVVMGRKTLESIGKPLPNRTNVVLSREESKKSNGVYWAGNVEDALFIA